MGKIKFPIPAEDVVPHKRPMSLLRHVIAHDSKSTVCDVRIGPDTLFLDDRFVDAWVGLEYMAQAVGAHAGMKSRLRGEKPEIGFLLGTRRADFFTKGYRLGDTLTIVARHVWGEGDLFSFDCKIADASGKRTLATAQLNVYRPADPSLFLKRRSDEA